jgi:hypothetical protein
MKDYKKPYFGVIIGIILLIVSASGELIIIEEELYIDPNSTRNWSIQMYPGQKLQVAVICLSDNTSEVINGILELVVIKGEMVYLEQKWVATNVWSHYEANIVGATCIRVILNNNERASNSNEVKKVYIDIKISRPYGYLILPSMIMLLLSIYKLINNSLNKNIEKKGKVMKKL